MTKHFARPQFPPRPTKGTLVAAAKKQVKADEAKASVPLPPVDESKLPDAVVLTQEDAAEKAKKDEQLAKDPEVVDVSKLPEGGDLGKLADAIMQRDEQPNDAAAGNEPTGVPQTPAEQPSAPAAASPPTAARAPKGTDPTGLYALGKKYSPKTDRNAETWGKICKALVDGPKTMKELTEAVKGHGDFLGYMTRGGHIVPAQPAKTAN